MKQHFQHRHQQEQPNAEADRNNQHRTADDSGYLRCQHLQIRLRHRDEDAHEEADGQQCRDFARAGQSRADMLAHRSHCHIRAKIEQRHPDDQHHGGQQENGQFPCGQTDQRRQVQDAHQRNHRRDGKEGFLEFCQNDSVQRYFSRQNGSPYRCVVGNAVSRCRGQSASENAGAGRLLPPRRVAFSGVTTRKNA